MEHLLFLGSEKFPESDYYRKFIGEGGGRANAWTFLTNTLFHFDITPKKLEPALDVLANQLSFPKFSLEDAAKEIFAVQNEHSAKFSQNYWNFNS